MSRPPSASILCATDLAAAMGPTWPVLGQTVYFVAHELRRRWPELERPDSSLDLSDVPPTRLHLLENTWVVSTYLRLRARGLDVKIVERPVPDHVNVCSSPQAIYARGSHRAFLVVAQGDRSGLGWGDYTLAQSPALARAPRTCLIDHWPQPGLTSRDPARGEEIRRLGYFGYPDNLAAPFRGAGFQRDLRGLGVELVLREDPQEWHDYRDLDLSVAVRGISPFWTRTKPATKLFHAWITSCPALLGAEPAYRYWGRDGQDYFEVQAPGQILAVVRRLRADPALYRQVQERGRTQARLHDEEAVCRQWAAVLAGPVAASFEEWRSGGRRKRLARLVSRQLQRAAAPLARRVFLLRARGLPGLREGARRRLPRGLTDSKP